MHDYRKKTSTGPCYVCTHISSTDITNGHVVHTEVPLISNLHHPHVGLSVQAAGSTNVPVCVPEGDTYIDNLHVLDRVAAERYIGGTPRDTLLQPYDLPRGSQVCVMYTHRCTTNTQQSLQHTPKVCSIVAVLAAVVVVLVV